MSPQQTNQVQLFEMVESCSNTEETGRYYDVSDMGQTQKHTARDPMPWSPQLSDPQREDSVSGTADTEEVQCLMRQSLSTGKTTGSKVDVATVAPGTSCY